jgi:phage baseplate assembly protein W
MTRTQLDHPLTFDGRGRTAATDEDSHIWDLIEQVLFTRPGERVNRPDFGAGLLELVFQPNSDELAATTQFLVQGALQQWLGDVIEVEEIEIERDDATLTVRVAFSVRGSGRRQIAEFTRAGAAG